MGDANNVATRVDDVLKHYGIKGMKWGVRRSQAQLDSASEESKRTSETKTKAKKSGTSSLSNKELQDAITRMNLEKQYTTLSSSSKQRSAGAKFVSSVMGNVAKQQVTKLANDVAAQQINQMMNKKS